MKKGNIIKFTLKPDNMFWYDIFDENIRFYKDFEDKTGIFLEVVDCSYSLILVGDEQIVCWSDDLVRL